MNTYQKRNKTLYTVSVLIFSVKLLCHLKTLNLPLMGEEPPYYSPVSKLFFTIIAMDPMQKCLTFCYSLFALKLALLLNLVLQFKNQKKISTLNEARKG